MNALTIAARNAPPGLAVVVTEDLAAALAVANGRKKPILWVASEAAALRVTLPMSVTHTTSADTETMNGAAFLYIGPDGGDAPEPVGDQVVVKG